MIPAKDWIINYHRAQFQLLQASVCAWRTCLRIAGRLWGLWYVHSRVAARSLLWFPAPDVGWSLCLKPCGLCWGCTHQRVATAIQKTLLLFPFTTVLLSLALSMFVCCVRKMQLRPAAVVISCAVWSVFKNIVAKVSRVCMTIDCRSIPSLCLALVSTGQIG